MAYDIITSSGGNEYLFPRRDDEDSGSSRQVFHRGLVEALEVASIKCDKRIRVVDAHWTHVNTLRNTLQAAGASDTDCDATIYLRSTPWASRLDMAISAWSGDENPRFSYDRSVVRYENERYDWHPVDAGVVPFRRHGSTRWAWVRPRHIVFPWGYASSVTGTSFPETQDAAIGFNELAHTLTARWEQFVRGADPEERMFKLVEAAIRTAADDEYESRLEQQRLEATVNLLAANLAQRERSAIERVERDLQSSIQSAQDFDRRAREADEMVDRLRARAAELRAGSDMSEEQLREKAESELHKIHGMSTVHEIHPDGSDGVRVVTNPLPCVDIRTGRTSNVSPVYHITISPQQGYMRIVNHTDPLPDGYDHPHVSNGDLCAGNHRQLVTRLIRDHDYSGLIELIADLLGYVNPNDVYTTRWTRWFSDNEEQEQ